MTAILTPEQLRKDLPEFSDTKQYPDPIINLWVGIGTILLANTTRWSTLLYHGLELFVAHNITLAAKNQLDSVVGNLPGLLTGPISSQSVDKVSESYDAAGATNEKAAHWNLTVYGSQFVRLSRMIGAGGLQI